MKTSSALLVSLAWAVATVALCRAIGEVQAVLLVVAVSAIALVLFLSLWNGSTFGDALLAFGVPAVLVVAGGLLFGLGHRAAGYVVFLGSGALFPMLAYRAFARHWADDGDVAGAEAMEGAREFDADPMMEDLLGEGWWSVEEEEPRPSPALYGNADWPFADMGPMETPAGWTR